MLTNDYLLKYYIEDRQKSLINETKLNGFKKIDQKSDSRTGFIAKMTKFLNEFKLPVLNKRNCNCNAMS